MTTLSFLRQASLVAVLFLPMLSTGGIYKWVDSDGNVHFGDAPPTDRQTEEVEVAPSPSKDAVKEAEDRAKRLQDYRRTFGSDADGSSRPKTPKPVAQPATSYPSDVECFTPLGESWGGRIADSRGAVERRPLSENELRQLKSLLRPLVGRWSGTQEDVTCINPQATPPAKVEDYDFRLNARRQSEQLFGIEADLVGRKQGLTYRQFFWFLLSREGLRFRKATNDLSFEIDQPGNDVEVLAVGSNELTFFWRRGGATRKVNVISLRRSGATYAFAEFFYTQGILSGKRLWKLGK